MIGIPEVIEVDDTWDEVVDVLVDLSTNYPPEEAMDGHAA
jgi:hypothetical protein